MAEFAAIRFETAGFHSDMAKIHKAERRATLFATRSLGRHVAATAKTLAPRYPGPQNAEAVDYIDPRATAEAGSLRLSIRNARRIRYIDEHTVELKVGPFGTKSSAKKVGKTAGGRATRSAPHAAGQLRGVALYRREIEGMYGYMEHATAMTGSIRSRRIYEDAYDQAFKKALRR